MAEQAITQEQLFLPLIEFIADHGGEIDRESDELLDALADRLGLNQQERTRTTEGGRAQWRSTVEYCRQKLIDNYGAIDKSSERGIWRLSEAGWRILRDPPPEMIEGFEEWKVDRENSRPDDSAPPPERPSGNFRERLEQMSETLRTTTIESLRLLRNQAMARAIKEEYHYRCQLCDSVQPECPEIPMERGRRFVEAHHIQGLAEVAARAEHGQLDDSEYVNLTSYHNIVVVCPYHHGLLHHHHPPLSFDRAQLAFVTDDRSIEIRVVTRRSPHLEFDE